MGSSVRAENFAEALVDWLALTAALILIIPFLLTAFAIKLVLGVVR